MKLPGSLQNVGKLPELDKQFRKTLDTVLDKFAELIDVKLRSDAQNHAILSREFFLQAIEDWCERNPRTPARLLTIQPWDESFDNLGTYNFPEAVRREIFPVIEQQFDESVLFAQLDSRVFALFLTNDHGTLVTNEFDWASKLQGLESRLTETVPLSFHFESANWPRDASTAHSLLDAGSPPDTEVGEFPGTENGSIELESKLDSVLEIDLRSQIQDKIPQTIRDKLPPSVF